MSMMDDTSTLHRDESEACGRGVASVEGKQLAFDTCLEGGLRAPRGGQDGSDSVGAVQTTSPGSAPKKTKQKNCPSTAASTKRHRTHLLKSPSTSSLCPPLHHHGATCSPPSIRPGPPHNRQQSQPKMAPLHACAAIWLPFRVPHGGRVDDGEEVGGDVEGMGNSGEDELGPEEDRVVDLRMTLR
ncbi:hypothetical protein JB92DRAFT_3113717 [Gautieria morchelliformis]|nr:hypothetical protein JB92DRAFT_3113717 [Gautieria morchelliformis]